jgi:hypothetical protein
MEEFIEYLTTNLSGFRINIGKYKIDMKGNDIILTTYTQDELRDYKERDIKRAEYISKHIGRNVDYIGRGSSGFWSTPVIYKISITETVNNIPLRNYKILSNDQVEQGDFYEEEYIIIEIINQLRSGNDIKYFTLRDKILYYNETPVLIVNCLKETTYYTSRSGEELGYPGYEYNFHIINEELYKGYLYSPVSMIQKSFNDTYKNLELIYGSVSSENFNWIVKNTKTGEKKHFKSWFYEKDNYDKR